MASYINGHRSIANNVTFELPGNTMTGEIDPTYSTQASFIGQLYLNTTTKKLFYCASVDYEPTSYGVWEWQPVASGAFIVNGEPVASGNVGQMFVDTTTGKVYIETPKNGASPEPHEVAFAADVDNNAEYFIGSWKYASGWQNVKINTECVPKFDNLEDYAAVYAVKLYRRGGQCITAKVNFVGQYQTEEVTGVFVHSFQTNTTTAEENTWRTKVYAALHTDGAIFSEGEKICGINTFEDGDYFQLVKLA